MRLCTAWIVFWVWLIVFLMGTGKMQSKHVTKQIVGKYVREIRHENALIDHQLL